jgi:hypothetical protein
MTSLRIGIDGTYTYFVTFSPDSGSVFQALDGTQVETLVESLRRKDT